MSEKQYAKVGGQAVIEGIMMRSPKKDVLAVRDQSGNIVVEPMAYKSIKGKCKFFKLPFVRGVVGFVDSLIVGYKSLMRSAEFFADEDDGKNKETDAKTDEPSVSAHDEANTSAEDSQSKQTGSESSEKKKDAGTSVILFFSALIGVALAVAIFIFLPAWIAEGIQWLIRAVGGNAAWAYPVWLYSIIKGVLRIIIMLVYISLVSFMKDIKRLFQYHGAEHKTIFCLENRKELTVENVRGFCRLHPRCGTSFLLIVFFTSIVFSILISAIPVFANMISGNIASRMLYTAISILFIPIIAGLSYELQQYTGRHDNLFTKIVSAPGLAFQKITTKEPSDDQIEVAIAAIKASLTDDEGNFDPSAAYKK